MTPTITTDAVGRREATPELATVEVTASGDGDSAATAHATARDRAATVRDALTAVSADRVRTVDISIEESTELFGPETDAQYRATERLHVDCTPDTVEAVVEDVADAGGAVRTTRFHLHEDVRRRLQDEALTAAMERAREKAERIATAEGRTLDGIRSVTAQKENAGMESIADDAFGLGPEMELHPDPVEITQTVEVVYELTVG